MRKPSNVLSKLRIEDIGQYLGTVYYLRARSPIISYYLQNKVKAFFEDCFDNVEVFREKDYIDWICSLDMDKFYNDAYYCGFNGFDKTGKVNLDRYYTLHWREDMNCH